MIKVIANNTAQAMVIINSFKNTDDLTVVIKENTATENSDVKKSPLRTQVVSYGKLIEMD